MDPPAAERQRQIQDSSDVLTEAFGILVEASGGRLLRSGGVVAFDLGSPAEDLNHAVIQRPLRGHDDAAAIAAELQGFYPSANGHMVWDPWPTVDPRPFGYRVAEPPLMIRPAGGDRPPDPPGLDVREVLDRPGLDAVERVLVQAFPLTGLIPGRDRVFGPGILDHPKVRLWVGWLNGRAVSTSMAWSTRGYTFIGYIATLAEARGHGCGAAVTWRATLANPAAPALLHASALGRPVYQRMGYETIAPAQIWIRIPAPSP